RHRARRHGSVDQVGGEGDHYAVAGAYPRAAGEICGEHRTRERNVGNGLPQRVGDDRRFDPAGQRIAGVLALAQLQPAGASPRLGEALAPLAVIEIGHGTGSELASQAAGGAPQLGLFGRVAGIHGARIELATDESHLAKGRFRVLSFTALPRPVKSPMPREYAYHRLTVADVIDETADTRSFVLDIPPAVEARFAYVVGQYCTFRATVDGEPVVRCYSMSSSPETGDPFTVTVKRVPGGKMSNW